MTICIRPDQLKVSARNGRPGPNQIPAELKRTVEKPQGMRLEFAGASGNPIHVDLAHADYELQRDNKDWVIQFPAESLRVV